MDGELRSAVRQFADEHIRPHVTTWDTHGVPAKTAKLLGDRGWLVNDDATLAIICDEIGAACTSTRSLITVQNLMASALRRWGTDDQKTHWLPQLQTGEVIAGFCLTEAQAGSDASAITTTLGTDGNEVVITGTKLWVTFGAVADIFLAIGQSASGATAVMIDGDTPGLTRSPITGQLGLRGAQLADISFDSCRVPATNLVGRPGFGISGVAATAIDHGRFTIACGCVGIIRDCLKRSVAHATSREQSGRRLADHQLVARLIARMHVALRTSELLCESAARMRMANVPGAAAETMLAKYVSAQAACEAAADAVQILGGQGVDPSNAVERHFRDSKIMRIIEGTDQMLEQMLADYAVRENR